MGRSLLQSSPTDRDMPECDLENSLTRSPRSTGAFEPREKTLNTDLAVSLNVQQDATVYGFIILLQTALHVSGDTLIHHQEHRQTVITTSGIGRTVR